MVLEEKQIRSVFSQGIMHNFHSSTSEKRKRKSGEIRGKFPLFNAGETKEKAPGEEAETIRSDQKNSLSFHPLCPLFAPAFPPLFTLFTPHEKQGFRSKSWPHSLSFSQPGIFSPLPFRGAVHGLRRRKKLPHELILMSVKVQREMVLEEKRIRSVSCQTFIQNFPSFHQ